MSGILLDGRRIMAYEGFMALGEYAGRDKEWLSELWQDIVEDDEIMGEFMYYLDHHGFKDELKIRGYGLTDMYVFQMDRYNLIRDIGKNTESCNKESMVLGAFRTMADMKRDPDEYELRLQKERGQDRI